MKDLAVDPVAAARTDSVPLVERKRSDKMLLGPKLLSWAILIALGVVWQLLSSYQPRTRALVSSPLLVFHRIVKIAGNGVLWHNLAPTLEETVGGLAIGMAIGIVGGFIMARSRLAGAVLDPYVIGINGLPRVALAPFFVVWFGIGIESKVLLAASIVFVAVLFNVREGMQSIDQDLLDALRSMRASRWEILRHLIVPSLTPWLIASLKVGIGLGLTGSVVGELVGASTGLGWYITNSLNIIDITGAISALLIMALLAMVMYYIVLACEKRLLRWRADGSGSR